MSRQEPGSGRLFLILIAGTFSGILGNVLATWADTTWGLSKSERIGITAATFIGVVLFLALLEIGVTLPGSFAVHRYWYLFGLVKFEDLNQWATKFVALHVRRGRKYVATIETLDRTGERQDLVKLMYQVLSARHSSSRHLLILGEPGCGKSTAAERLTLQLARHSLWRLGLWGPIPVLVRAGDYRPGDDLKAMLTDALERWAVGTATRNVLIHPKSVRRLIDSGRLVILLDALDELADQRRTQMINMLATMAGSAGLARIAVVVTCRTRQDPEHLLPDYRPFSILDLSDEAIVKLIEVSANEFDVDAEQVDSTLRHGGFLDVGGIGRNPFWLRELIHVGAVAHTRAHILLAASRQRIMAELAKQPTAERSWRIPETLSAEQYTEECQRALAVLALGMDLGRSMPRDEALALLGPILAERAQKLNVPALVPNHVLELARDAALLDRRRDPVAFSHRIVQEFFAAYRLWSDEPTARAQLVTHIADPGRWQTLMMYAGLLADVQRDKLIEEILSTDQSPVGLACAIAVYVGDARTASREVEQRLYRVLRDTLMASAQLDPQLEESLRRLVIVGHDQAAHFLGVLLADAEPVVRLHVCWILRFSVAPEAVRFLAHVGLDDSDEAVARAAIESLVAIGEAVVWPLIRQLSADRVVVRTRAAQALGLIGAPEATNFLLRSDIDDAIAGAALARCSNQRVGRLLVALASREVSVRRRAVFALGRIHSPTTFRPMLRATDDPDEKVRAAVLQALATWPTEAIEVGQIHPSWGTPPLGTLMQVVHNGKQSATDAVLSIGMLAGDAATHALLTLLEETDAAIRTAAIQALSGRLGEEVTRGLLKCLQHYDHYDHATRAEAAKALQKREGEAVTAALIQRLDDPYYDVRIAAIQALSEHPGEEVTRALLKCLQHFDPATRAEAAKALQKREGEAVTAALIQRLDDQYPYVRIAAVQALSERPGEEVTPALARLLKDRVFDVRLSVVHALINRSDVEISEVLLPLINDTFIPEEVVQALIERIGATRVLALATQAKRERLDQNEPTGGVEINGADADALPIVLESLRNGTPLLRQLAAAALQEISSLAGTDQLAELLTDAEPTVRRAAASSIVLGSGSAVAGVLAQAIGDGDSEVRSIAVRRFIESGRPDHTAQLAAVIEEYMTSPSAARRLVAVDLMRRAIEVGGQHLTIGPQLVILLLRTLSDSNSDVVQSATEVLDQVPTSWIAVQLPRYLLLHEVVPTAALLDLVARSGEPHTIDLIAAALVGGDRETRTTAVHTAAAFGNIKLLPMLLRVVHDETVDQHLQLNAVEALALMGPVVWPQLRELLADRSLPEPLTAAVVEALGMSGDFDGTTAYQLLNLISHPSPRVSAAAVNALGNISDQLQEILPIPRRLRSADARIQVHILRSLLRGQPLPDKAELADMTIGMTSDEHAADQKEQASDEEFLQVSDEQLLQPETITDFLDGMRPHMLELIWRMCGVVIPMFFGVVAGALVAQSILPFISDIVFGVTAESLQLYLPPSPYQEQIIGLSIAAWLGLPVLIAHLWLFFRPGLLPREIRLAQPIVIRLTALLALTPLLAALIAHLISRANLQDLDEATLIWLTMRITVAVWCIAFWVICFRPMWRWLAARAKSSYLLSLELDDPILKPTFLSDGTRRRLLLTAFFSLLVLVFVPVYLTTSVILSVPIILHIMGIFVYQLGKSAWMDLSGTVHRLVAYLSIFSPLLNIGIWFIIAYPLVLVTLFVVRGTAIESTCRQLYGMSSAIYQNYCANIHPGFADWFVYTYSVWILALIMFAAQIVSSSIQAFRKSRAWRLVLANLILFGLLAISPALTSWVWKGLADTQLTENVSVAVTFWLSMRVPIALVLCLWFGGWIAVVGWHRDTALIFLIGFVLMITPVTVLLAILCLPGVAVLLAIPAIIDLVISYGPRDLITRGRGWLRESPDARLVVAARRQLIEVLDDTDGSSEEFSLK